MGSDSVIHDSFSSRGRKPSLNKAIVAETTFRHTLWLREYAQVYFGTRGCGRPDCQLATQQVCTLAHAMYPVVPLPRLDPSKTAHRSPFHYRAPALATVESRSRHPPRCASLPSAGMHCAVTRRRCGRFHLVRAGAAPWRYLRSRLEIPQPRVSIACVISSSPSVLIAGARSSVSAAKRPQALHRISTLGDRFERTLYRDSQSSPGIVGPCG